MCSPESSAQITFEYVIEKKVTPQAESFEKITLVIFENLFARGVTFFEMTYERSNLEHEIMASR